ncbi:glycopeptide [Ganoderma leucocontextum]|nr:glycopeptide [Ganoderma leucocontextum]
MQFSLSTAVVALAALVGTVVGETHTVHFSNNCRFGIPTLIQGGVILSNGGTDYVSNGPLSSAIAYLQTGSCGFNGENCTLIETTLVNTATLDSGSLTGISLLSPHKFSVPTGFNYFNGCNGAGADCTSQNCPAQSAPVSCKADNVNLNITFCA